MFLENIGDNRFRMLNTRRRQILMLELTIAVSNHKMERSPVLRLIMEV